ncbi:MAG TPA: cold shock domain-containing protein [Nitrospiria bacterium]|jgi:CspA family cold shock protein
MKLKGTIKKIEARKGSGFILAEDGREFFFHKTHLEGLKFNSLQVGDAIEFEFDEFRGQTTPKAMVTTIVRREIASGK